jgi:hypothetical protein
MHGYVMPAWGYGKTPPGARVPGRGLGRESTRGRACESAISGRRSEGGRHAIARTYRSNHRGALGIGRATARLFAAEGGYLAGGLWSR